MPFVSPLISRTGFTGQPQSPEALAQIVSQTLRNSFRDYVSRSSDSIDSQIASLNDNTLVTDAIDSNKQAGKIAAENARVNSARFGLSMTPEQRKAMMRLSALRAGAGDVNTVNNARIKQRDRNENVALDLSQQQRSLLNDGRDNILQAVGLGSARERNNKAGAAAARNANLGLATSLVTGLASI